MKICFLLFGLLAGISLAEASVQTTVNQDKPPYIYVKSFNEKNTSSANRTDNIIDGFPTTQLKEYFSWNYSSSWNSDSTGQSTLVTDDILDNYNYYGLYEEEVQWNMNTSWPPGTDTQQGITSDNSGDSGTNIIIVSNVPPPYYCERCDETVALANNYSTEWFGALDLSSQGITGSHTIQIQIKMKTGGKSTSKLHNLIGFTATAEQMIPPWNVYSPTPLLFDGETGPNYFIQGGIYGFTWANVPPQQIQIGGYGAANTNGNAYIIAPDNADVDVTPYVSGMSDYSFALGTPQKYHSYFDVFVQQANPGYSLIPFNPTNDVGHAFWQFRTDAPSDAMQYISTNLTEFLGQKWGFYPLNGLFTVPGILQNGNSNSFNIQRSFYIGFSDLLEGLIYTRGVSNAPPVYSLGSFDCVGAARGAGFAADVFGLPSDASPQNFGVTLIEMYPAPGQTIGLFTDTNDVFYSSAPY